MGLGRFSRGSQHPVPERGHCCNVLLSVLDHIFTLMAIKVTELPVCETHLVEPNPYTFWTDFHNPLLTNPMIIVRLGAPLT